MCIRDSYIPLGGVLGQTVLVDAADRAAVGQRPGVFCGGADQLNARCRGQGGHQIPAGDLAVFRLGHTARERLAGRPLRQPRSRIICDDLGVERRQIVAEADGLVGVGVGRVGEQIILLL